MKLSLAIACTAGLAIAAPAQQTASLWFGTWKLRSSDPGEKPETLIYSDAGGGAMRMVSVESKSVIVTKFDGKPAADIGEGAARGNALAVKAVSPTSYSWTFLKAGKPFVSGRNSLAADRKTFSEVSWLVTKPTETVTLIFEKLCPPVRRPVMGVSRTSAFRGGAHASSASRAGRNDPQVTVRTA